MGTDGSAVKLILFNSKDKIILDKANKFIEFNNIADINLSDKQVSSYITECFENNTIVNFSNNYYSIILPDYIDLNNIEQQYNLYSVKKYLLNSNLNQIDLITRARQLAFWNYNHQFCGRCSSAMRTLETEYAKECTSCGYIVHPRITPCVLAAVINKDKILLGRAPHFPPGVYSLLAGFIEVGESCEQTVAREVFEESGVKINNIKYYGSQSWPFPHSLMLGFTADYVSGDIIVAKDELEDARWFTFEGLRSCPDLLPAQASLSRMVLDNLIQDFTTS